jgi:hypothetical protein
VIDSDAHESNELNVSMTRGLSSFHSKIYLSSMAEVDLGDTIKRKRGDHTAGHVQGIFDLVGIISLVFRK